MIPKPPATITEGIIANPSNPSVRFTALLVPIITKTEKKIKKIPKLNAKSFKKGRNKLISCGVVWVR